MTRFTFILGANDELLAFDHKFWPKKWRKSIFSSNYNDNDDDEEGAILYHDWWGIRPTYAICTPPGTLLHKAASHCSDLKEIVGQIETLK